VEKIQENRAAPSAQEDESNYKKKVGKASWGIAKDKANLHVNLEKVQVCV
jgi:hypothetical protein